MGTINVSTVHPGGAQEDNSVEAGAAKVGLLQVRSAQDDVPQVGIAQVRLDEGGAREVEVTQ
jgi:hypothetical protein